jgi:hypothetical protein
LDEVSEKLLRMPVAQMAICMYLILARMMTFQSSQGLANGAVTLQDEYKEGMVDVMVLQVMREVATEVMVIVDVGIKK